MGRIRTRWVKSMAEELVRGYPGKFGKDYNQNKNILREMGIIEDKPVRNKVAGYIVRVVLKSNA